MSQPSNQPRSDYRGRSNRGRGYWRGLRFWKQRNQHSNNTELKNNNNDYNTLNGVANSNNTLIVNSTNTNTDAANHIPSYNVSPQRRQRRRNNRIKSINQQNNTSNVNDSNNNTSNNTNVNTPGQIDHQHNLVIHADHKHSPAVAHKKRHSSRFNGTAENDIVHSNKSNNNELKNELIRMKAKITQLQSALQLYRSPYTTTSSATTLTSTVPPIIQHAGRSTSDPHLSATKTILSNHNTLLASTYSNLLPPPIINHQPTPDYYDAINSGASSSSDEYDTDNTQSEHDSQSNDGDASDDDNNNGDDNKSAEEYVSESDHQPDTIDIDSSSDELDELLHSSGLSFTDSVVPKDGLSSAVASDSDAIFDNDDNQINTDNDIDDDEHNNEAVLSPNQRTFKSPTKRMHAWQPSRIDTIDSTQLPNVIQPIRSTPSHTDTSMLDNVMRAFGRANINATIQSIVNTIDDDDDDDDDNDNESHTVNIDESEQTIDVDDSTEQLHSEVISPTDCHPRINKDIIFNHKPKHKRISTLQSLDCNDSNDSAQDDNDSRLTHSVQISDNDNDNEDHNHNTSHNNTHSSHASTTHTSIASSRSSWCDRFPFEENIFILSRLYEFINRVYTCKDAVTYRAISKQSGKLVCIKLSDSYDIKSKYDPKEVRLLSRSQGHSRICTLESWHPIPSTNCYAIVMEWVNSTNIEYCLFNNIYKIRQYMYDLLSGLQYMHHRGVLYRDIKPSNILWDDSKQHATYIDYDVGTFYDAQNLHRSIVGTDGYMAPELVAIDQAKQSHQKLPYSGYGLPVDLYSAGVVFGSLLYGINEDEIADLNNVNANGDAIVARVLLYNDDDNQTQHLAHAYNLLLQLLDSNPHTRINVDNALQHEFFTVEGEYLLK